MNPKPLRILVACAVVAAGLLCWYLLTMTTEPAPRRAGKVAASAPPWHGKSRAAAAPWPEIRTPEFRDRVRDKTHQWLDARGRDAAGLIALWDLTKDDALLDEAEEKFPDDFRVCMAMIERFSTLDATSGAALPWIEKIIAAEPKNSEGYYLKSRALHLTGDLPGALAALRAATKIGLPRENHRPDRAATLENAVAACGLPAREAALAPLSFYKDNDLIRSFLLTNERLVLTMMDQFKSSGDIEQSLAVGRTGLASLLNLDRDGPQLIANEALTLHYTASILSHLPDDWRFHPNSLTVSEWKTWAEEKFELNRQAQIDAFIVSARLDAAPDEVVVEYSRRFLKEGERKANTWLREQPAPAHQ